MGIDVKTKRNNKHITLNNNHDRLVVTDPDKNPVEHDIGLDKLITAIFQRKKAKNRSGDGNPLIYALKEMKNCSISDADRQELYRNMLVIINKYYSENCFDEIVPLPSSKPVSLWVAKACSDALNIPLQKNAFFKATNANVLNQLIGIEDDQEIIELRKLLEKSKPNGNFTMKDLTQHQREFVQPIKANPYYHPKERILLVDDLVSSGASFKSAYSSLSDKFPQTNIECLTLLGPVTQ